MTSIRLLPVVALGAVLLCGCKEEAPAPPTAATPSTPAPSLSVDAAPAPAPVAAPGQPAPTTAEAEMPRDPAAEQAALQARIKAGEEGTTPDPVEDPNLGQLQSAADSFYNEHKRAPASLEEMVKLGSITRVPRAPAGKKYVVDSTTGEVKSVNSN